MARAKTETQAYEADPAEKFYLIVNPAGAMHVVSEAHARSRLALPGWRMATVEEKAKYKAADGNQRAGRPLAKPFSPAKALAEALPLDAEVSE